MLSILQDINANPIHKNIQIDEDGRHIEIGLEFELNMDIKLDGKPVGPTTEGPPPPEWPDQTTKSFDGGVTSSPEYWSSTPYNA